MQIVSRHPAASPSKTGRCNELSRGYWRQHRSASTDRLHGWAKYVKPTVPLAPEYKEAGPDASSGNTGWRTAEPSDATQRGAWWTIFGDAELNALEPMIARENQDLKAADARFRQARALIRYNRADLSPTVGVAPSVSGLRNSANRPYFNSANANKGVSDIQLPLDLNYEIDLWGRIRHGVNASREEAQASAGDLQTALLSLQAELAIDYFEARSADAQEKLLNDTVKEYEEAYRITNNRFEGGVAPRSDVDQARTQLEAARVQASDVHLRRAQYEHAIAVLTGQPPASFTLRAAPLQARPPKIPVGLPSELLERRPILPPRNVASRRRTTASGLRAPLTFLRCRWVRRAALKGRAC